MILLVNLSRILIIQGIMKIYWKSLTEKVFEYKASCKMNGKPIITRIKSKNNSSLSNSYKNRKINNNNNKTHLPSISLKDKNRLSSKIKSKKHNYPL
jgi:hypothetical protein